MRQLGLLLSACKEQNKDIDLINMLSPHKLDTIIEATKSISYSESNTKNSISLALKIGQSKKMCSNRKKYWN